MSLAPEQPTNTLIDECVRSFCTINDKQNQILGDARRIGRQLSQGSLGSAMDTLATEFGFTTLYTMDMEQKSFVLSLRKCFAIGWMAPQCAEAGNFEFLEQLGFCIRVLESCAQSHRSVITACATAAGYSLSQTSTCFRNVDIRNPGHDGILSLIQLGVDVAGGAYRQVDEGRNYFVHFLLNSIYAFHCEKVMTLEYETVLQKVCAVLVRTTENLKISKRASPELIEVLLGGLESDLSLKTKNWFVYVLAFLLKNGREDLAGNGLSLLYDRIAVHIASVVRHEDFGQTCERAVERNPNKTKNCVVTVDEVLAAETFEESIPILMADIEYEPIVEKEIKPIEFMAMSEDVNHVIYAVIALCNTVEPERACSINIDIMRRVIELCRTQPSLGFVAFVMTWAHSSIAMNMRVAVTGLARIRFFEFAIMCVFETHRHPELIRFLSHFMFWLLSCGGHDRGFIGAVFAYLDVMVLETEWNSDFEKLLISFVQICPPVLAPYITLLFFDKRIEHAISVLQRLHVRAVLDGGETDKIVGARLSLFRLLNVLMSNRYYKNILFRSTGFMTGMIRLVYEKQVREFTLAHLKKALLIAKADDRSILGMFQFFKTVLNGVRTDEKYADIAARLWEMTIDVFQHNGSGFASILLRTDLFGVFVGYVDSIGVEENLYVLLKIADRCSRMRVLVHNDSVNNDLFGALLPLTKKFFPDGATEEFMTRLWNIVFAEQLSMDEPHDIKNGTPLTLIFHLLKDRDEELLRFLAYVGECTSMGVTSAIAVGHGGLPGVLIGELSEYRSMTEPNKGFDAILDTWSQITSISTKSRDLARIFHNFSTLNGNFRPFFSVDILKSFLFVFQSPYDNPLSFYHLSGLGTMLKLPKVKGGQMHREFSFYADIELLKDLQTENVLVSVATTTGSLFQLKIKDGQISFELKYERNRCSGKFNYVFALNVWTQVAITYQNRKISLYVHGKEQASLNATPFGFVGDFDDVCVARNVHCNLGAFGLLCRCMSPMTVSLFATFPRNIVASFAPAEGPDHPSEFSPLFNGGIFNSAVYIYNAAVAVEGSSVNLANVQMTGAMLEIRGEVIGYSPKAKDAMPSIGGASSFLPLFAQIDQPLLPKEGEAISYDFNESFLSSLIQVLLVFLRGSFKNQEEFAMSSGFVVIGHLLSRTKVQNITPTVIGLLKRMYKEILVQALARQMLEYIYLDMRLWIYLPIEVQLGAYKSLSEIFAASEPEGKRWFASVLSLPRVLQVMRAFFWTSFSDARICLLAKPRLDKVTKEVSGTRPSDMKPIRDEFWRLAEAISRYSFSAHDASTLCSFAFDRNDPDMTLDTLTFIIRLIRQKNRDFLQGLCSQKFTFESFFPLLVSDLDLVHAQCIHIFVLFQQLNDKRGKTLMSPYTLDEWVAGIISTIDTTNMSTIFADVVFGYMFGLFGSEPTGLVPDYMISQRQTHQDNFRFAIVSLLPLAMMIIADFRDDICHKYLKAIDRAITTTAADFIKREDWDQPFIIFLMNRLRLPESDRDESASICLHMVSALYMLSAQLGGRDIVRLPLFVYLISSRSGMDYSHIIRMVLAYVFDMQLAATRHQAKMHIAVFYQMVSMVFEYMFFLDDGCTFYIPDIEKQEMNVMRNVSFQALHKIKGIGVTSPIRFTYGTRTSSDAIWFDVEVAEKVLTVMTDRLDIFKLSIKHGTGHDPLFIFALMTATGIRHSLHTEAFLSFVPVVVAEALKRSDSDLKYDVAIIVLASMAKAYFETPKGHPVHRTLFSSLEGFDRLVSQRLKIKIPIPTSGKAMSTAFDRNRHNVLHSVMIVFAKYEANMPKMVNKFKADTLRALSGIARRNELVVSHLERLSAIHSQSHLSVTEMRFQLRLLQFAASVRNAQRDGLKMYRRLWRQLSSAGGAWCPSEAVVEQHWKVDRIQLGSFRRNRLTKNYAFNDHMEASLMRDHGNTDDVQLKLNELLKKNRMSEFAGDRSVVSIEDNTKETEDDQAGDGVEMYADNITFKADANLVTMKLVYNGALFFTRGALIFQGNDNHKHVRIELASITHVFFRRYLLLDTSIEIFTKERRTHFIDFVSNEQRAKVLAELEKMKPRSCVFIQKTRGDIEPMLQNAWEQWCSGRTSNFDYLMEVNRLAGRTYNDLGQYPVFPWVIADYTSETLDLTDVGTFRNLGMPLGAISEARLQPLTERFESGGSPEDAYLYASFYSSQAVVIGYLIRLEPFTTLHIELQSGRFDIPARLFSSIEKAWSSVTSAPMDFRELIPEFFYAPEFLVNSNGFDFGEGVGDVVLPPWASSPRDFIEKNRAALESDFVTAMLPRWIDMIFGVTSRGPDAVYINNIFCPYFYSSYVTEEVRRDAERLQFVREYAACFGQAPDQIYKEPHHSRDPCLLIPDIVDFGHDFFMIISEKHSIISLACRGADDVLALTSDFTLMRCNIGCKPSRNDTHLVLNAEITSVMIAMMTSLAAVSDDFMITATPWDTAFTIWTMDGRQLYVKRIHTQRLTAVATTRHFYATGSLDCTIMLWRVVRGRQIPYSILSKFDTHVSCLAINETCDLCIGCSSSGEIISASLCTGDFIHKIILDFGEPTHALLFNNGTTCIAVSSSKGSSLVVLDENLNILTRTSVNGRVVAWCPITWFGNSNYVFVALSSRRTVIYSVPLCAEVWHDERCDYDFTCVSFSPAPPKIVVGTKCGKVLSLPFKAI